MKVLYFDDMTTMLSEVKSKFELKGVECETGFYPLNHPVFKPHDCSAPDAPCRGIDAIISDMDMVPKKTGDDILIEFRESANCVLAKGKLVLFSGGLYQEIVLRCRRYNIATFHKSDGVDKLIEFVKGA
jgi:hypothetical protein